MPISKKKISYTIDLSSKMSKVKPGKRKQVAEDIGFALLESIAQRLQSSNSPVSGGAFKKSLSKEYAEKSGKNAADLNLTGDMLSNLSFDAFKDKVVFKITNSTEKKKAFNHNVGDTLPQRQFIPDDQEGEHFKKEAQIINKVISDAS